MGRHCMWPQLFIERWFSEERNPLDGYDNGFLNLNKMLKAGPTLQPIIQYWDSESKAQDSCVLKYFGEGENILSPFPVYLAIHDQFNRFPVTFGHKLDLNKLMARCSKCCTSDT